MGRALSAISGLGLVCVACRGPETLPMPEVDGAQSFLLHVVESERVEAALFGPAVRFELSPEDRYLRLSAYRESLAELGLSEGPLSPAPCRACTLRQPISVLEIDTAAPMETWRPFGGDRDEKMLSIVQPDGDRCEACTLFEAEVPTLESGERVHGAIVLPNDGSRALVIDRASGAGYWASATGPIEPACLGSPSTPVASAFSEGPEAIWVADSTGTLSRWETGLFDPALPCGLARTASTAAAGESLVSIDGATAGAAREIFAMGGSGQFHRYAAGAWQRLAEPLLLGNRMAVWRAPGRGMASTEAGPVLWYEQGRVERVERVLVDSTELAIHRAKRIDGVGLVLGAKPFLLVFEDGEVGWRRAAGQSPTGDRVDSFTRHGSRYFVMLNGGRLRELLPDERYCEAQNLFPEGVERELVALNDGTLIMTAGPLRRARPVRSAVCE